MKKQKQNSTTNKVHQMIILTFSTPESFLFVIDESAVAIDEISHILRHSQGNAA